MPKLSQMKKDAKGQYDPQVGEAAKANAAIAERSVAWTEDFYAKFVAPALEAMTKSTEANTRQQGDLFDMNMSQAKLQDERYRSLGIPAEDRYYRMVDEYSQADEQERQAQRALGDVRTAKMTNQDQMRRKFQGLGIDPTSPAALSAMTDMAVQDAAVEAAAATRAREAAKTLGMSLTADAANFGRGGQSGVLQFGAAASGNSSAATAANQSAVGAASSGAAPMQGAFGLAQRAYGANLDAYAGLNKASMEASAQASSGFGQLLGLAGSAAIGKWSDRRLKKNIRKIATAAYGIGVYLFHYLWDANDAEPKVGYMADEVRRVFPHAVTRDANGYDMVDYSKVMV